MENIFKCPKCNNVLNVNKCNACNYNIRKYNDILLLTEDSNSCLIGENQYIGYDHIGESYSLNNYSINEVEKCYANEIYKYCKNGILLDLGCGDGFLTIPCAELGIDIIAGDISINMLKILSKKAKLNNISLDKVKLVKMNALDIPLIDNSIDVIVSNSVLHLISNPLKVINEIHRVLKKDGVFICFDDAPGIQETTEFDNSYYYEIVNEFYSYYWKILNSKNIYPTKLSWKYDRDKLCESLFIKEEKIISINSDAKQISFKDGVLKRIKEKGFSEQANFDDVNHNYAFNKAFEYCNEKFGYGFEYVMYQYKENDKVVTIYKVIK